MKHTLKKVIQHREEWVFYSLKKEAEKSGYSMLGEIKLAANGVWQALMAKEVEQNPNYNPNKPRGWGQQAKY